MRPDYEIDESSGCWVWQKSCAPSGHGQLTRKGKNHRAHRFYYEREIGPIPPGLHLHHICRNPACVNPGHLELLDPSSHSSLHAPTTDAGEKVCVQCGQAFVRRSNESLKRFARRRCCSRRCSASENRVAKLDAEQVRQIRALLVDGVTQVDIASAFNISQPQVSAISGRRRWPDIA